MPSNILDQVSYGQRVAEVIEDLGISKATAARLAGINPGRLTHIIADHNRPRPSTEQKMSAGWLVPSWVFHVPRSQATAVVRAAKKDLEKAQKATRAGRVANI